MTDSTEEEEANKINIKVQGNDADSKKTFQVLKVKSDDNTMTVLGAIGVEFHFQSIKLTSFTLLL